MFFLAYLLEINILGFKNQIYIYIYNKQQIWGNKNMKKGKKNNNNNGVSSCI